MLLKFTVGNYKVFKEKTSLDLRAANVSELSGTNVLVTEREDILKSAVIYGKNAGGKSSLLHALEFMKDFVISSSKDRQANQVIEVDPFRLNVRTAEGDSFFEIELFYNEIYYRYGFEVNKLRVSKEWLFERKKSKEYPLFLRIEDEYEIDEKRFPEGKGKDKWTRPNALFLSLSAQLSGDISTNLIDWFAKLIFVESEIEKHPFYPLLEEAFAQKENILQMLQDADVDIQDIRLDEEHDTVTYHKVYDEKKQEVGVTEFYMETQESGGTVRFFELLPYVMRTLSAGGILLIDEIGKEFHTLLSKAVVLYFNSKKNKKAQLIFTTHDTNLLNKDLLRRDQIYFVEKNKYGEGRLYSLADFKTKDNQKVRKDADYEANYLKGRYGAIPFINEF